MNVEYYGPPIDRDLEDYWKRIAAQRLGVRADQLIGYFHPIGDIGEYDSADFISGTGGIRTHTAGYYRLDTASATGTARYYPGFNSADHPVPVAAGAGVKFWMGMQCKFPQGIAGANTIAGLILRAAGAGNEFMIGKRGSQSTTNIVVFGSTGTPFDTGVAFDTNGHTIEVYRADGATTVPVIDGIPRTTGNARPTNACGVDLTVDDNAGARQQLDVAWYGLFTTAPSIP